MANRRTEDFFVTFGSDARDFSRRLKTDLQGAHQEISALNRALAELDRDVARRAAGGGAGSGLFTNLAQTVTEISKLPGSFKTIASDLNKVIGEIQTAVGNIKNLKIQVPRAALQVKVEDIPAAEAPAAAPAATTQRRRQAQKKTQDAAIQEQRAAEESAVAAETTAKSAQRSAAAKKKTAAADKKAAEAAEQEAVAAEQAATQAQNSARSASRRHPKARLAGKDNSIILQETIDEAEKIVSKYLTDTTTDRLNVLRAKVGAAKISTRDARRDPEFALRDTVQALREFEKTAVEIVEATAETVKQATTQAKAQPKPKASAPQQSESQARLDAQRVERGLASSREDINSLPLRDKQELARALGISAGGNNTQIAKRVNEALDALRTSSSRVVQEQVQQVKAVAESVTAEEIKTAATKAEARAASKLAVTEQEADAALQDYVTQVRKAARQPPSEINAARGRANAARNEVIRLQGALESGSLQDGPAIAQKIARQQEIYNQNQAIVDRARLASAESGRDVLRDSLTEQIAARQSSSKGFGTKAIQPGLNLVGSQGIAEILAARQFPITEGTVNPAVAVKRVIERLRSTILNAIEDDAQRAEASLALENLGRKGSIDSLLKSTKSFTTPDIEQAVKDARDLSQSTGGLRPGAGLSRGIKDLDLVQKAVTDTATRISDEAAEARTFLNRVTNRAQGGDLPENLRSADRVPLATIERGSQVTETGLNVRQFLSNDTLRGILAQFRNSPRRDFNLPVGGGSEAVAHEVYSQIVRSLLSSRTYNANSLASGVGGGNIGGGTGSVQNLPAGRARRATFTQLTPEEANDPQLQNKVAQAVETLRLDSERRSAVGLSHAAALLYSDPNFNPFTPAGFGLGRQRDETPEQRSARLAAARNTGPIKAGFATLDALIVGAGQEIEKLREDLTKVQAGPVADELRQRIEDIREVLRNVTGHELETVLPGATERQSVRDVFAAREAVRSEASDRRVLTQGLNAALFGQRQAPGATARDPLSGISLISTAGVVVPGRFASRQEFQERFPNATPAQEAQFEELVNIRRGTPGRRGIRRGGLEGALAAIGRAATELDRALEAAGPNPDRAAQTRIQTLRAAKAKADAKFQAELDRYIEGYAALFGESRPILPEAEQKARLQEAHANLDTLLSSNFQPRNERDEDLVRLAKAKAEKDALLESYRVQRLVTPAAELPGTPGGAAQGPVASLEELLNRVTGARANFDRLTRLAQRAERGAAGRTIPQAEQAELAKLLGFTGTGPTDEARRHATNTIESLKEQLASPALSLEHLGITRRGEEADALIARLTEERAARAAQKAYRPTAETRRISALLDNPDLSYDARRTLQGQLNEITRGRPTIAQRNANIREVDARLADAQAQREQVLREREEIRTRRAALQETIAGHQAVLDTPQFQLTAQQYREALRLATFQRSNVVATAAETQRDIAIRPIRAVSGGSIEALDRAVSEVLHQAQEAATKAAPAAKAAVEEAVTEVIEGAKVAVEASINKPLPTGLSEGELATAAKQAADHHQASLDALEAAQRLSDHLGGTAPLKAQTLGRVRNTLQRYLGESTGALNDTGLAELVDRARSRASATIRTSDPALVTLGDSINRQLVRGGGGGGPIDVRVVSFGPSATTTLNNLKGARRGPRTERDDTTDANAPRQRRGRTPIDNLIISRQELADSEGALGQGLFAFSGKKLAGALQFSVDEAAKEVTVHGIETRQGFERRGVAAQLHDELLRQFPGYRFDHIAHTPEGAAFTEKYLRERNLPPGTIFTSAPEQNAELAAGVPKFFETRQDLVRQLEDANKPRTRAQRTDPEVAAAERQARVDAENRRRESERRDARLAQYINLPGAAQQAITQGDALGAVRALTAEGYRLSEAITRVREQLGLSATEASELREQIVRANAEDRKSGRRPGQTAQQREQERLEAERTAQERADRVKAARAAELATLPTAVQNLIRQQNAQGAVNALAQTPGFTPGTAVATVARQLGIRGRDDRDNLRIGLQTYLREQRNQDTENRKAAAATEQLNEALRIEEARLSRVDLIMPKLTASTQLMVRELQKLIAEENRLKASGQAVPEGLAKQIEDARVGVYAAGFRDLRRFRTVDEFGRERASIPSSEQAINVRDLLGTSGPETTRIGREAAARFTNGLEAGLQAQQASAASRFFGPQGFFGRLFSTGASYIVRQFSAGIVFGIGNEIQRTFSEALSAQSEFVRISNGLQENGADQSGINNLRSQLQSISSDLGQPLHDVYVTASQLVGVFDTPQDIAFATKAVEQLKLISNGALNAQEGVQSLAAAQEAFPQQFEGAAGFQQLVDLATQLQNVTGINLEDQLKGLATIGPQAKALQLSPTDALLLPGLIAKRTGQSGDAASEQFSRILASLQSGKGQQALRYAGVTQAALGTRNYNEIFRELFTNISEGKVDQTAIQRLVNVAGPRQARAFQAVLDNPTKTLEAYAAASESAGAGTRRVQGLMNTLNRELKVLQQNLTGLVTKLIDIGALDVFGVLLKGVNELLKLFNLILGLVDRFEQSNGFTKFLVHSTFLALGLAAVLKTLGIGVGALRTRLAAETAETEAGAVGAAGASGTAALFGRRAVREDRLPLSRVPGGIGGFRPEPRAIPTSSGSGINLTYGAVKTATGGAEYNPHAAYRVLGPQGYNALLREGSLVGPPGTKYNELYFSESYPEERYVNRGDLRAKRPIIVGEVADRTLLAQAGNGYTVGKGPIPASAVRVLQIDPRTGSVTELSNPYAAAGATQVGRTRTFAYAGRLAQAEELAAVDNRTGRRAALLAQQLRRSEEAALAGAGALSGGTAGIRGALGSGRAALGRGVFGANLFLGGAGAVTRFGESMLGVEKGASRASRALAGMQARLFETEKASKAAGVISGTLTAALIALPFILSAVASRSQRHKDAQDALNASFPEVNPADQTARQQERDKLEQQRQAALKSEGSFGQALIQTYFSKDVGYNVLGGIEKPFQGLANLFGAHATFADDVLNAAPGSTKHKSEHFDSASKDIQNLATQTQEQIASLAAQGGDLKEVQDAYTKGVRDIIDNAGKLDDSDIIALVQQADAAKKKIEDDVRAQINAQNALKGINALTTDQLDALTTVINTGLNLGRQARLAYGTQFYNQLKAEGVVDPNGLEDDPTVEAQKQLLGVTDYQINYSKLLARGKSPVDRKTGDILTLDSEPSERLFKEFPDYVTKVTRDGSLLDRMKAARATLINNLDAFDPDIEAAKQAYGTQSDEYKAAVKRKTDAIALINQLNQQIITEAIEGPKALAAALAVTGGSQAAQDAALSQTILGLQQSLKNLDPGSAAYEQQIVALAQAERARAEFRDQFKSGSFAGTLALSLDAAQTLDPLKAARDQQAITAQQLKTARSTKGYSQADINQLKIQAAQNAKTVAQLIEQQAQSQASLAIAIDNAAGDTVQAAKDAQAEADRQLRKAIADGTGQTDINTKRAAAVTAAAATRDAILNDTLNDLDFQRQMGQISINTYIQGLQNILKQTNLTKQERQNIQLKIKQLQDDLKQQLTGSGFNIPTDIKLPTAYQVRRSLGLNPVTGGTGGAQPTVVTTNNNPTVNINAPTLAVVHAVAQQVVAIINGQTETGARANSATPRLVGG